MWLGSKAQITKDEFTEMGNVFREEFGLKTKMTHAERKELEELEEKRRKQEIQKQKNAAFQDRVTQLQLLQQIKSLLDAGVLTQEEFETKKKEILNG